MKFQFYRLEPLTPVHVGTGDSLDPFSYVIRGDRLHYIDLAAWVESHPDPEGLTRKFSGEVHAVRAHIAQTIDVAKYSLAQAKVMSKEITVEYEKKITDSRNQLKIAPGFKNNNSWSLVIPGSSIKGAIRTAVLDLLDREHGLGLKQAAQDDKRQGRSTRIYEDRLRAALGDIGSNAFKQLKVSDFEALPDSAAFVTAREMGRKVDKQPTPKDPCEVLPGACMGPVLSTVGKIGVGSASALEPRGEALQINFNGKRLSLTANQLAEVCSSFYRTRYLAEKQKFYSLPHFGKTARALESIEKQILSPEPGTFVLRIGHYSHVECMTVTENDPETRKTKDGKWMPHGTTRTLADGVYPFGWVRLVPCSEQEYVDGLKACEHAASTRADDAAQKAAAATPMAKPVPQVEAVLWERAQLVWNPGSAILSATSEGKKAEMKLGGDRTIVPEGMHNKLFGKKQPVQAKVTLEKEGNLLKITKIEPV